MENCDNNILKENSIIQTSFYHDTPIMVCQYDPTENLKGLRLVNTSYLKKYSEKEAWSKVAWASVQVLENCEYANEIKGRNQWKLYYAD